MNKASEEIYEQLYKEMSIAPVPVTMNNNKQAVMFKSIGPRSRIVQ